MRWGDGRHNDIVTVPEWGLTRVTWHLTRQRPNVEIQGLQRTQYHEVNTKLHLRYEQLMKEKVNGEESTIARQVKELKSQPELTDELVKTMVDGWGFQNALN